ncbi:MAG: hypothetical protein ACKOUT_11090 [Novosphingobium sp.]
MTINNDWRKPDDAHPSDKVMIRSPSLVDRYGSVADAPFPAWLRSAEARRSAEVTLNLLIAADGSIASCRAARVEAHEYPSQAKRTEIPADLSLGEQACALVRSSRKFRPAIDAEGRPIEAPMAVAVHYRRERYEMLAPPAPPPPSRYLGDGSYRSDQWPPAYYHVDGRLALTSPRFKDFIGGAKDLPAKALVGAVIRVTNTGQVNDCQVRLKSADKRLDDATCAALMTVRGYAGPYGIYGLPVEVTWQGSKAKAVYAGSPILPNLVSPIAIPSEILPSQPPKWPSRVRILLDGKGQPLSCTVIGPTDIDALDAAACKLARQGQYTGAKDGFGRPAASGADLWVDWKRGTLTLPGY